MATTTNFGWETPDDTDLVKDGALAMRTLGNAIDASLVDLKGGTTGQVLSKTSNTDMDFTWVTSDDANAIQNAIVDAKGDLIAATANDTPARLAVGNNGETLVADSSTSTGLRWQGNYAAGKNKIINGDFAINQRSFTSTSSSGVYTFDRWRTEGGVVSGAITWSAQTFTPGTAPEAGYESTNFFRTVSSGHAASSDYCLVDQRIEDVRTFANQTVTVSFWAKASSGTPKIGVARQQFFGSGGSSNVNGNISDITISTSWARYSATVTIPSVSGKTIGAGSYLRLMFWMSAGSNYTSYTSIGVQNATIDIWGIQVENGNVATAFQTATGTLAGELAACQRYYYRQGGASVYQTVAQGWGATGGAIQVKVVTPVTMRTAPTTLDAGSLIFFDQSNAGIAVTGLSIVTNQSSPQVVYLTSTTTTGTQYRPYDLAANNTTAAFLGLGAEL